MLTEERKAYLAAWRDKNRQKLREYHIEWRRSHGIEEAKEMRHGTRYGYKKGCRCEECGIAEKSYQDKWKAANPDKELEKQRRYRERNPERVKAKLRKWQQSPQGRARLVADAAKRRGATGVFTKEQWKARMDFFGWACWLCGSPWEATDHVKPIAKGGSNWPANLRPICSLCNSTKGARWNGVAQLQEVKQRQMANETGAIAPSGLGS